MIKFIADLLDALKSGQVEVPVQAVAEIKKSLEINGFLKSAALLK